MAILQLPHAASADLVLLHVGDSVSAANRNRIQFKSALDANNIGYNFVGDVETPFEDGDIDHQSFSGNSLRDVLHGRTRFDEFQAGLIDAIPTHNPTHIMLLGGYNDINQQAVGSGLSEIKGFFTDIADYVRDNSDAKLVVSNLTDLDPALWPRRQNVLDYNAWLADQVEARANAGQSIALVDNFSVITAADRQADGLHLNGAGQTKVGNNWARAVGVPEPSLAVVCLLLALFCVMSRSREDGDYGKSERPNECTSCRKQAKG